MKIGVNPVVAGRIKTAWKKLSDEQRTRITPLIVGAHQQAVTASLGQVVPRSDSTMGHALPLAFSALSNDQDAVVSSLGPDIVLGADGGGEIWGTGKYEQLDPGWLESVAEWLEHFILAWISTKPIPPKI